MRSIDVCRRLVAGRKLARVVMVGGPTVMPALRQRVGEALGAPFAEDVDPMTVVARGAAIFAATAGLDARPAQREEAVKRRKLWLQFPAMSSSTTPHVVGRLADGPADGSSPGPVTIRLVRGDDLWQSAAVPIDGEGGFVIGVELHARRPNVFRLDARAASGAAVAVDPATITIVQGMTISDPPLSRSIGVATADDHVHIYFERGAPLPARRTFTHTTVETVVKGVSESLLKIPIVQGELEHAHLCRLVGALDIPGSAVGSNLPAGSPVELTLSVDRGGVLSARAFVPALKQVFEHVAHLVVPEASPEVLEANVAALRARADALRADAFRRQSAKTLQRLADVEQQLADAARDAAAAAAGDADAGQKARRALLELDALLDACDTDRQWPELESRAREAMAGSARWLAQYGTQPEQQLYADVAVSVDKARADKDAVELQRQLRLIEQLAGAARARHPEYWTWVFEAGASEAHAATDLPRAQMLVRDGRRALERGDRDGLRAIAQDLWRLIPADAQARKLGFDSGVR
jgi:molecular chaperone DnaK